MCWPFENNIRYNLGWHLIIHRWQLFIISSSGPLKNYFSKWQKLFIMLYLYFLNNIVYEAHLSSKNNKFKVTLSGNTIKIFSKKFHNPIETHAKFEIYESIIEHVGCFYSKRIRDFYFIPKGNSQDREKGDLYLYHSL